MGPKVTKPVISKKGQNGVWRGYSSPSTGAELEYCHSIFFFVQRLVSELLFKTSIPATFPRLS